MDNKSAGIVFVLLFFLATSTMLLTDYKNWETPYFKLIQISNGIHTKAYTVLKNNPKVFIESAGALGILLSFAGIFGSKFAIKSLSLFTVVLILALNNSIGDFKVADFQSTVVSSFSLIAICGGLMQAW